MAPPLREADGADGKRDGHAEQQPFGHDGGDRGSRVLDCIGEVVVTNAGRDQQQRAERGRRNEEHAENAAKANLERRLTSHDFARVGGKPLRIGFFADTLGGVIAATGGREATGEELVAGAFADRCGLTGEERLINFGAVGDDVAVSDDLVAGTEEKEVALNNFFRGNTGFGAAAHDGGPRAGERD